MSALAQVCVQNGESVSGSDISENIRTQKLAGLGVEIFIGHAEANIRENVCRVVVSTAIDPKNEELLEARRQGISIFHRSDLLAEMFLDHDLGLAVAGCHGKTTVSSMIATMLSGTDYSPTCVIGGHVDAIGGNACIGESEIFVAEADESDATFLKYFSHSAVITNIDNDHMDHYDSLDSIVKAFEIFAGHIDPAGTLYISADDPIARNIAQPENRRILTFGVENPADFMAENINYLPYGSRFTLTIGGIKRGTFELNVPGCHNILNALPAIAFGLDVGLSLDQIRTGLAPFHGAGRRFEVKGIWEGITVIDDYGHHPNEIRATLAAARTLGANKVVVVFQPHRYSRTQFLSQEFGRCFDDCDSLFITDIYPASEEPIPGVSSRLILDHMPVSHRRKVKMVKTLEEIPFHLSKVVEPGDVIFTMGAGSITRLGPEILESMKNRSEQIAALQAEPAV